MSSTSLSLLLGLIATAGLQTSCAKRVIIEKHRAKTLASSSEHGSADASPTAPTSIPSEVAARSMDHKAFDAEPSLAESKTTATASTKSTHKKTEKVSDVAWAARAVCLSLAGGLGALLVLLYIGKKSWEIRTSIM